MSPEEDRTGDAVDSEPKHYQRTIPAPFAYLKTSDHWPVQTCLRGRQTIKTSVILTQGDLRADTVVEDKLVFKLVKTTGHCRAVHGKFLIVLDLLVTTTSTDTLTSKGTLNL